MEYTLRELKSTDIFTFVQIVNKIGFKEFSKAYENIGEKDGTQIMLDILGIILENLGNCKGELYKCI